MSYEIKETGMVNHILAAKRLNALFDALILIDQPWVHEFVAGAGHDLKVHLAKCVGWNTLQQMEAQDLERAKADEGAKP